MVFDTVDGNSNFDTALSNCVLYDVLTFSSVFSIDNTKKINDFFFVIVRDISFISKQMYLASEE